MIEAWKPVKGFEDFYRVSNTGKIISLRSGKERVQILNTKNGYLYCVLCDKNIKKTLPVHRIVAEAFVPNEGHFSCVNHINECKTDNACTNLEWCTKEYNNTYNGKAQRCCKPILQIDMDGMLVSIWGSARKADASGIANYKNISACCRGIRKTAGGYQWRFIK